MTIQKPIFVVPYNLGTVTCQTSNEIAGKVAAHVGEFNHIGMVFRSSSSGTANPQITGDFGSAKPVDFFAMLGVNATAATGAYLILADAPYPFSSGTQYNTSTAQTIINPSITRTDGLYNLYFELPSTQTFRYWAIYIYNHTGEFECAKVVLGKKVQLSKFYSPDYARGVEDLGEIDVGRYGVPAITPGRIMRSLKMTFGWITTDEYESTIEPLLLAVGNRTPIYCCFDPEATVYRNAKTFFGWLRNPGYATGAIMPGCYSREFELLSMI